MMRTAMPACALAAILAAGACTTDPLGEPIVGVVRIEIEGASADGVMLIDTQRALTAAAIGPGDVPLEERDFEWRSSDPDVATIDADGLLVAGDPGETIISARTEGLTETLEIFVREGTTVPNGGTRTVNILAGKLRLSVPSSVGPTGTVIHAREALTWPSNARIVAGSVIELGPDGTELGGNITVGITFQPADIPAVDRPALRLHALNAAGQWVELTNGSVDLNNFRVSGGLMRLSKVAIFRAN